MKHIISFILQLNDFIGTKNAKRHILSISPVLGCLLRRFVLFLKHYRVQSAFNPGKVTCKKFADGLGIITSESLGMKFAEWSALAGESLKLFSEWDANHSRPHGIVMSEET